MGSLQETDYLALCKKQMETSANMGDCSKWAQQDYEHLSNLIYEKTNVLLSVSTLKRIWIYRTDTIPNISTLDALSQFLDYRNWYHFKSKCIEENRKVTTTNLKPTKWNAKWILYVVLCLLLIATLIGFLSNHSANKYDFKLQNDSLIGVPNTVNFQYDFSKSGFDYGYIQQDWDPARRVKIYAKEKSLYNTYHFPGFFEASLVVNGLTVKKIPVFIKTDGWVPVVMVERFQVKPTYIDKKLLSKNLHLTPETIQQAGIDITKEYFTNYFNVRDFEDINCENVTLISEIKNNAAEGGSTNQYSEVILKFQHGRLKTPFSKVGTTSGLDIEYGEKYLDGSENDFSSLGTDLSDWKNIKIQVINKHVYAFVSGQKVYDLAFEDNMGKLVGIQYCFNGCGSVRKSELYDQSGKLVFSDYFGN